MKFHLDGDTEFPTLCGTGTEDYFGGAWNFDLDGAYHTYSTPFLGFVQALPPGEINRPHQQFGMYRWHLRDPICSSAGCGSAAGVGLRDNGRYLPLETPMSPRSHCGISTGRSPPVCIELNNPTACSSSRVHPMDNSTQESLSP